MSHVVTSAIDLLLAALFGGMLFFPSIVAPRVFRVLDADHAGQFLRALFPGYYAYIVVTAGLAGVLLAPTDVVAAGILLATALSTLVVRQWAVPKINAWRDAQRAGDEHAGARFEWGHRATVWLNMAQMLAIIGVIVVRAVQ